MHQNDSLADGYAYLTPVQWSFIGLKSLQVRAPTRVAHPPPQLMMYHHKKALITSGCAPSVSWQLAMQSFGGRHPAVGIEFEFIPFEFDPPGPLN